MAKSRTEFNRVSVENARKNGRVEIRCWLPDRHCSESYRSMADQVPKRQLGILIGAMVKLAEHAQKNGDLQMKDGKIYLYGKEFSA